MESQEDLREASLGETLGTDFEENPEEIKSKAVHEEIPKKQGAVKPIGALRKRHEDWHRAVMHRSQQKKGTQGSDESQKQLATASEG
jgi:hypothetical protein